MTFRDLERRLPEEHLRNIQALTDATLSRLDIDDMLVELLDRVRDILNADTAAILLVDEGSRELVARAARGLEEEVYQNVRVSIRMGFAGRIAAERRPVLLDRVDETTVSNPILWEKGIRTMLGVPLFSGGDVMGVLHVGSITGRTFTTDDTQLLELVADRVAGALHGRLLGVERAASKLLELSLLPPSLPSCPGLRFAVRYVAAEGRGVGGDWYDLFVLPTGELWVVAGDVAGHGLKAAVVMGRLRSTLRAYALQGSPPEEVLALTDRKLQHFELGEMATAVCAVSVPPFDQFRISSAGHLPPILALPGEAARPTLVRPDPPLGATENHQRTATTVPFPAGALLLLYTDGLIERRGEALDTGIARLCSAAWAEGPDAVCRHVMMRLVGNTPPQDDIALVAVQRS